MTRVRIACAVLAALFLTAAAASCASSPSSAPAQSPSAGAPSSARSSGGAPEKTSIVVGVLPAVATAPLYIAIKEGLFKQAGLTVTPRQVAVTTESIPLMLHGTVDIASSNMDSYLAADASGVVQLRILNETDLCSPRTLAVLTTPRTGITTPAQLAGKTIAVNAVPTIQTITINRLVGPAEAKTLHYVKIPFANMAAALAKGQVDAISALEPFVTAAEHADGASVVLDQCGGKDAGIPLGGFFATASWTAKYPNTARAFQQAINRAQALANKNPALIRQVLPTFMPVTPRVTAAMELPKFATGLNSAAIQQVADLAYAGGEAKTRIDVGPLLFG